ncbi:MAG TPA: hypothetical protein VGC44_08545, partial [Longimicrobiales bacterium]
LIDIAQQERHNFAEGKVRVTFAAQGIAIAKRDDDILVCVLCGAREFSDERRLAGTRFARDEAHLPSPAQCLLEMLMQPGEVLLASYEVAGKYLGHGRIG